MDRVRTVDAKARVVRAGSVYLARGGGLQELEETSTGVASVWLTCKNSNRGAADHDPAVAVFSVGATAFLKSSSANSFSNKRAYICVYWLIASGIAIAPMKDESHS